VPAVPSGHHTGCPRLGTVRPDGPSRTAVVGRERQRGPRTLAVQALIDGFQCFGSPAVGSEAERKARRTVAYRLAAYEALPRVVRVAVGRPSPYAGRRRRLQRSRSTPNPADGNPIPGYSRTAPTYWGWSRTATGSAMPAASRRSSIAARTAQGSASWLLIHQWQDMPAQSRAVQPHSSHLGGHDSHSGPRPLAPGQVQNRAVRPPP
jgi:hypothetical protein